MFVYLLRLIVDCLANWSEIRSRCHMPTSARPDTARPTPAIVHTQSYLLSIIVSGVVNLGVAFSQLGSSIN